MRAVIHTLNRGIYWNPCYYHKDCMTTARGKQLLKHARFEDARSSAGQKRKGGDISQLELMEIGAEKAQKKKRLAQEKIQERADLREIIRKIRSGIARRLNHEAYKVFPNRTLDALVEALPCNEAELIKVHGFGPKKTSSLGPFILPVINAYMTGRNNATGTTNSKPLPSSPGCVTKFTNSNVVTKDEEVVFESEISIDEMINRKIREAEERGEVIVLDI